MKCSFVALLLFVFFVQYIAAYIYYPRHSFRLMCQNAQLQNGKVRIRARGRIIRYTCNDGYYLVGNRYSTCSHMQWDPPTPLCVSPRCSEPPLSSNLMMLRKLDGAILVFFCEAGYKMYGSPEIYCDGKQWNSTVPVCRAGYVPLSCDFENPDLCLWQQDPQHDFDWRRHNFGTPSLHIGTGPGHDHTLGPEKDGHYLYIEASGRMVNDTARIISPLYNSSLTQSGCFSFWYHMYGHTIGTLNVYFKQETDKMSQLMFTKKGNQGPHWLHSAFDLPKVNNSFQIIIEGIRGNGYVSDIAIDDVAILQGSACPLIKNESTDATADSDNDQVEIINAQQSCKNKCVFAETTELSTPNPGSVYSVKCLCTLDCMDNSLCCPDYIEYCVSAYVTEPVNVTYLPSTEPYTDAKRLASEVYVPATAPQAMNATKMPDKNNSSDVKSTKSTPVRKATPTGIPINPKDDIDPSAPSSPKTTTTEKAKPIATEKTPIPVKTTTTTRTKNFSRTTVYVRTQQTEMKETPFVTTTLATKYMELQDQSELHGEDDQNREKVKQNGVVEGLEVVVAIGATLAVLSVGLVITLFVIRRRKTYKRGKNGSALSEDSDVRFLTSDEILDFNLARPNDNDEL